MSYQSKFRSFIKGLLEKGKVNEKHIEKILTPENMDEFRIAFTHPSSGAEKDYQLYEFLGDVVFNEFVPYHIRERFPNIVSVKWITRIKHTLVSSKSLAKIAMAEGLNKFAIYGNKPFSAGKLRSLVGMTEEIRLNPDLYNNPYYTAMMEDIMEAFFGCLMTIILKMGFVHGVGTEISHNILRSFFGNVEIATKYEDVFDPVTRLKELYESKVIGLRWPNKDAFEFRKIDDTHMEAIVYGWPKGDKQPIPENRMILARATGGIIKDESKQKAAKEALEVLDVTWGISEIQSDPNQK